ncbi:MAG: GNAT family N-acetyltransferase [Caulobacterales bacterium 32-69-10]|nr:MAG: GNAT family N-acetyltransferase [Caulobacterales bacterium 32-69-10]
MSGHPLDRQAWSALTGRQTAFCIAEGRARRFHPEVGVFAAVEDGSEDSLAGLARLVRAHGDVALLEPGEAPPIPRVAVRSRDLGWQGVARAVPKPQPGRFDIAPLTEADAAQMLALATLTEPGPFFARTHTLGGFIGIKSEGRLVAMAGERMKPQGFTEISGVCTHPDYRGRGYGSALILQVAAIIQARGETPYLHAYASNTAAIALYETLGFGFRAEVVMAVPNLAGHPSGRSDLYRRGPGRRGL